jgi:hypothetical protein
MNHPISWYKECLESMIQTCEADVERLARRQAELDRNWKQAHFLARQIDEAKKRGMAEFDGGVFLVPQPNEEEAK